MINCSLMRRWILMMRVSEWVSAMTWLPRPDGFADSIKRSASSACMAGCRWISGCSTMITLLVRAESSVMIGRTWEIPNPTSAGVTSTPLRVSVSTTEAMSPRVSRCLGWIGFTTSRTYGTPRRWRAAETSSRSEGFSNRKNGISNTPALELRWLNRSGARRRGPK